MDITDPGRTTFDRPARATPDIGEAPEDKPNKRIRVLEASASPRECESLAAWVENESQMQKIKDALLFSSKVPDLLHNVHANDVSKHPYSVTAIQQKDEIIKRLRKAFCCVITLKNPRDSEYKKDVRTLVLKWHVDKNKELVDASAEYEELLQEITKFLLEALDIEAGALNLDFCYSR